MLNENEAFISSDEMEKHRVEMRTLTLGLFNENVDTVRLHYLGDEIVTTPEKIWSALRGLLNDE